LGCGNPLPLPMGEVARPWRDGEGSYMLANYRRTSAFGTTVILLDNNQRFLRALFHVCLPPASIRLKNLCALQHTQRESQVWAGAEIG